MRSAFNGHYRSFPPAIQAFGSVLLTFLILLCLLDGEVYADFKMNYNDTWDFSAHDKQAHFLGGMYLERAIYGRLHSHNKAGHIPSVIITIAIGEAWELLNGYQHNKKLWGDPAGFSKQDWGYVALGAISSSAIESVVTKLWRLVR